MSAGNADERVFPSSYFLSRNHVNRFKDEVAARANRSTADEAEADLPWVDEDGAADDNDNRTMCSERWKASVAEHKKRALEVYDVTGIFTAVCRHGHILLACEMVQSGEL